MWDIIILKSYSLFTRNSHLIGCPIFLFPKGGNLSYRFSVTLTLTPPMASLGGRLSTHDLILARKGTWLMFFFEENLSEE